MLKKFLLSIFLFGYFILNGQQENDTSFIDRALGIFDFNIGKTQVNVYPIISYAPSSGTSIGFMPLIVFPTKENFSREHRESVLSGFLSYSSNNWLEGHADTKIFTENLDITLYLDLDILDEKFYGIGVKGRVDDYNWYASDFINLDGTILRNIKGSFSAGLMYDFNLCKISGFDQINSADDNLLGTNGGAIMGFGPVVTFDSRDDVYYASKGSFLKVYGKYSPSIDKNNYNYWHFYLDYRKFFDLGNNLILAFQSLNDFTFGNVPFYKMPKLAGNTLLRGFENRNKYIDKKLSYNQLEVRKWLFWRLGAVAYFGAGNVFDNGFNDLKNNVKYVGGVGVRFRLREDSKINFRIDYGRTSTKDQGLFVTIRESF
jgi:hypothetical protein